MYQSWGFVLIFANIFSFIGCIGWALGIKFIDSSTSNQ